MRTRTWVEPIQALEDDNIECPKNKSESDMTYIAEGEVPFSTIFS